MSAGQWSAALLPVAAGALLVAAGAGVLGPLYPVLGWSLVAVLLLGGLGLIAAGMQDRRRARRGGGR